MKILKNFLKNNDSKPVIEETDSEKETARLI